MSLEDVIAEPEIPAAPEPEFAILSAAARRHAAMPAIEFDVHVTEPTGRQVYVIALTAQVMIEPARRQYDEASQTELYELFGPPDRWATTTNNLVWHKADVLVPSFTGATTFRLAVPASFDMDVAAAKYFHGVSGGMVPLGFNFNGMVHYRGDDGRLQMALVPWSATCAYEFAVGVWKELMDQEFPGRGWVGLSRGTLDALRHERARRGLATMDDTIRELLR